MVSPVKPGRACLHCGEPMVVITHATLEKMRSELNPVFRSLNSRARVKMQRRYHLCRHCDAHALGIDLGVAFPFYDLDGAIRDIHGNTLVAASEARFEPEPLRRKRRRGTVIVETHQGILLTRTGDERFLLPGGQAEQGEPRIVSALRELRSDMDLDVSNVSYLFEHESERHRHKVFYVRAGALPRPRLVTAEFAYYHQALRPELGHSAHAIITRFLGQRDQWMARAG